MEVDGAAWALAQDWGGAEQVPYVSAGCCLHLCSRRQEPHSSV